MLKFDLSAQIIRGNYLWNTLVISCSITLFARLNGFAFGGPLS